MKNRWIRICLVIVLIGVTAFAFGSKGGCFILNYNESGGSLPPPVAGFLDYLYELVIDTGWWKALSANYQSEGGLRERTTQTATSANYQND